jgi:hypothetical protein
MIFRSMNIKFFFLLGLLCGLSSCTFLEPSRSGPQKKESRDQSYSTGSGSASESGIKKRLGILPFLDFGPRPQSLRLQSQIRFVEEVNREGQMAGFLVNKEDLSNCPILNEEYDLKACAKNSQTLGYQALVEGKIVDFKIKKNSDTVGVIRKLRTTFEAILKMRVYSIRSQKEIFNTLKTVTYSLDDVRIGERVTTDQFIESNNELVEKVIVEGFMEYIPQVSKVLGKMNWEGRIAAVQGDKIYINVGSVSGIQVGDILRVLEEGQEIFDPEMGTSIGKAPGRIKGTLEVVSFFGHDGSVAIVHSGGGFKENDRLELY